MGYADKDKEIERLNKKIKQLELELEEERAMRLDDHAEACERD